MNSSMVTSLQGKLSTCLENAKILERTKNFGLSAFNKINIFAPHPRVVKIADIALAALKDKDIDFHEDTAVNSNKLAVKMMYLITPELVDLAYETKGPRKIQFSLTPILDSINMLGVELTPSLTTVFFNNLEGDPLKKQFIDNFSGNLKKFSKTFTNVVQLATLTDIFREFPKSINSNYPDVKSKTTFLAKFTEGEYSAKLSTETSNIIKKPLGDSSEQYTKEMQMAISIAVTEKILSKAPIKKDLKTNITSIDYFTNTIKKEILTAININKLSMKVFKCIEKQLVNELNELAKNSPELVEEFSKKIKEILKAAFELGLEREIREMVALATPKKIMQLREKVSQRSSSFKPLWAVAFVISSLAVPALQCAGGLALYLGAKIIRSVGVSAPAGILQAVLGLCLLVSSLKMMGIARTSFTKLRFV